MNWKEFASRILYVIAAIMIGSVIVYAMTLAGNNSKGPLENFLIHTTNVVNEMEQKEILEQREYKRSDKLVWYKPMSSNVEKLKHTTTILLGGSDSHTKESYESIINLEDTLHTTFPLIHIYSAWGSKEEEQFPKLEVSAIIELGSTPVITWEPWLSDFDEKDFPGIPKVEDRDKGCLAEIAKGVYDSYIKKWAADAKAVHKPIFLRVGHEFNDPYRYPWGSQNNKPEDFIAAWRHLHDLFIEIGATNILWVWSPHPAYGYFDAFYPGESYVDYVGVGVLNYGTAVNWSKWWTFSQIFGNHYAELDTFKKPIMITEFGSLAVGGDRSKWFAQALDSIPIKYPSVKSVIFYHYSSDKTTTDKAINWYIKDDAMTVKAIKKRISKWKH
ncbi:MAG: glycoside hydrolase family 26 protein [Bacteroidia bacterium]